MNKYYLVFIFLPLLQSCSTLTVSGAQVGFIDKATTLLMGCQEVMQLSSSSRDEKISNAKRDIYIELKNKAAINGANLLILDSKESRSFISGLTMSSIAYRCSDVDLRSIMAIKDNYIY